MMYTLFCVVFVAFLSVHVTPTMANARHRAWTNEMQEACKEVSLVDAAAFALVKTDELVDCSVVEHETLWNFTQDFFTGCGVASPFQDNDRKDFYDNRKNRQLSGGNQRRRLGPGDNVCETCIPQVCILAGK